MGKVVYMCAPRPRTHAADALNDVEHLLDLCREVELRGRWLTCEEGISIGKRLPPELMTKLESLVRTLHRL
jgi:hypothetical protein